MNATDFSERELRVALAAADRGMKLPYVAIVILAGIGGIATSIGMEAANFANPTHRLIVAGIVWLWAWMNFGGFLLQARQLAANARMLRALELMQEARGNPDPGA